MLVPLEIGQAQMAFLVPSLLPVSVPRHPPKPGQPFVDIYLACYTGGQLLEFAHYETAKLSQRCSLPAGLFEQVRWHQADVEFAFMLSLYICQWNLSLVSNSCWRG